MPFSVGDLVHLRGIGTGTVRKLRRGQAVVDIKGRTVVVDAAQLERTDPAKARHRLSDGDAAPPHEDPARAHAGESDRRSLPNSIDLHGHTVEEAIAALDAFVNDALLASANEARIIHGRSGGRVKQAVHARLRELPVRSVRLDPRNPGVTIVTF